MADSEVPESSHVIAPGEGELARAAASVPLRSDFASLFPELGVRTASVRFEDPTLIVLNEPLARDLGLDPEWLRSEAGIRFMLGNELPDGATPVAQVYAGHQFGVYSPRLGDGRALLLGELRTTSGDLCDVHLKGSGPTPFTRADGYAALGPMLREYLMGEAMHALGVPTTRALAVIGTGRSVMRDESIDPLPGAVLVRTAASLLRVGTFQFARSTGDIELLQRLVDHAIDRHDPSLRHTDASIDEFLEAVVERQAQLAASWMLVGFVHGVLNTDNVTISGETIDYGPCAFLDAYDPATVFSSIDQAGRYAYGNQPGITLWNLTRFAESLLPLLSGGDDASALENNPANGQSETGDGQGDSGATSDVDDALERAKSRALAALAHYGLAYDRAWFAGMRAKLGLAGESHLHMTEDTILKLASEMLASLREHRVDYTSFFRALAEAARGNREPLTELFSLTPLRDVTSDKLVTGVPGTWLDRWLELTPEADAMDLVNPIYIPRNELLDEALDAASAGDLEPFRRMLALVSAPFTPASGAERFERPEFVGIRRHITYCGT